MRKSSLIMLLALVCIVAVSASAYAAGLTQTDWPKYKYDVRNSGYNPNATAVAKPVIKWQCELARDGYDFYFGTPCGPVIDANNVYALDGGDPSAGGWFGVRRSDGNYLWKSTIETGSGNYGGMAIWNNGNSQNFVLGGPGWPAQNAIWFLDPTNGVNQAPDVLLDCNSDDAATVGPDGTIYTFQRKDFGTVAPSGVTSGYYKGGTIVAIDGLTRQIKWKWGLDTNDKSLGYHQGSLALATVNGKTVIICGMAQQKDTDKTGANWPYAGKNLFAIQDNGNNTASLLWSVQANFHEYCPVISNDGKTAYLATNESWNTDPAWTDTLYAYDVATGALKWSIATGAEHSNSASVGKDGTIYLASTTWNTRQHVGGRILAVKDNGTSATIKWTIDLFLEQGHAFSHPVVAGSNPPVIYVASTSGKFYAIQDSGAVGKILWYRSGPFNLISERQSCPTEPAIANDGTVYCVWGTKLVAFEPGFNVSGPQPGISGTVTDTSGNPIAGAYVAASISSTPLPDNADFHYAKTDATGNYWIDVPAGNWNVAAWAPDMLASANKPVTMANDLSTASASFALGASGRNWAVYAPTSTNNPNADSAYAASFATDANSTSRFASCESATCGLDLVPTYLMVDLKQNRTISQAVVDFEVACPAAYKLEYLVDGSDPATAAWTPLYSTTACTAGIPTGHVTAAGGATGNWNVGTEVLKFAQTNARYWRIYADVELNYEHMSIYEFGLYDPSLPSLPLVASIASARTSADGTPVSLSGLRITAAPGCAVPTDTFYVENADRSAGIRVAFADFASKQAGIGDIVDVGGLMKTDTTTGERYIDAATISRGGVYPRPLDALSMNNRNANEKASSGLFVKLTGKVGERGTGYFIIDDGGKPVKVYCGSIAQPEALSNVKVRGVLSTEGGNATLLVRDAADVAAAYAANQTLPLAGKYHYFRDCLIAGPFTDPSVPRDPRTGADALLAIDFIAKANTSTGVTETNVAPAIGEAVGPDMPNMLWKRYNGVNDKIDFNAFFANGTTNDYSVAYAVVYVYSPVYQTVDITTGSDDCLVVFVNGSEVLRDSALQSCKYGQRSNANSGAGFDLMPGLNTFVFKVVNAGGGFAVVSNIIEWGSYLTPTAEAWGNGTPVQGLSYYADRP